jgi:hypothetical protein
MELSRADIQAALDSPAVSDELKGVDPAKLQELANKALEHAAYWTDRWVYRGVVIALGFALVAALVGALTLAGIGKDIPEVVVALGSAAVGALAGLLAPSPAK